MIYLYLKTHNVTGLKYLGKTTDEDPQKYKGSGLIWERHIKKHGYDVTTEILFETEDRDEFKRVGLEYSKKWNIVESDEFANLCPEEGQGGYTSYENHSKRFSGENNPMFGKTHSLETRKKMSEKKAGEKNPLFGKKHSEETLKKMTEIKKGKKHSEETRKKMSETRSKKGMKHSEETLKKMTEIKKGKKFFTFEDGTTISTKDGNHPKFLSGLKYNRGFKFKG